MNKREQGNQYRVEVLRAVARLGYATTRQLAKIVWRQCDESSRKMCGRTLRWLLKEHLIVTKRDGDSVNGEQLSAVTAAGAAWVAKNGDPLPYGKAHARDWLRPFFYTLRLVSNGMRTSRPNLTCTQRMT